MRKALDGTLLIIALILETAPTVAQTRPDRVTACSLQQQNFCANKETVLAIQGFVVSDEGRVADAIVVVQEKNNPADPFTTVSDALGRFGFLGLKAGQYVLRVAHDGFEEVVQDVAVIASATTVLNPIKLTRSGQNQPSPASLQRVYYVTDRTQRNCKTGSCYGNDRAERGQLSYGHADLNVPETAGSIALNHTYSESDKDAFLSSLKQEGQDVLIFVHGFDNSFESAIRELTALAHDLRFKGPAILFSWASRDQLDAYFEDESTVDWSAPHFRQFLRDVYGRNFQHVHLIAHSMGNRLLLRWFEEGVKAKHAGQAVFVAPDVDADTFQEAVSAAQGLPDHFTMYGSRWDQALLVSETLHRHFRAGLLNKTVIRGLDTIDASDVDTTFIHHSYLVGSTPLEEDLAALLANNPHRNHLKPSGKVWELH
jgi:esterase/lipase superfamily enzyme